MYLSMHVPDQCVPVQHSATISFFQEVGLGVVAGIVFGGDTWFVGTVLDSLLDVVRTLGENGLVGLLVAAMLIGLLK